MNFIQYFKYVNGYYLILFYFLQASTMADMTTLIVISSFIMFPAVMMAQEVVNHGGNDK